MSMRSSLDGGQLFCCIEVKVILCCTAICTEIELAIDSFQIDVDVGVDANSDEENSNSPTMGESVSEDQIGLDPTPITADRIIYLQSERDVACESLRKEHNI